MSHPEIRLFRAALIAITVALCPLSQAWSAAPEQSSARDLAATVATTKAEMEEIIVSGRLDKLSELRKAIVAAEDRAYSRYNEVNKGRRYDIHCITEAPLGTNMKARNCEAQYVTDGKSDAARDFMQGHAERTVRLESSGSIVNSQLSEMRRRMLAVARSDVAFQQALIERALLMDRYNMLLEKKFDGHTLVWD